MRGYREIVRALFVFITEKESAVVADGVTVPGLDVERCAASQRELEGIDVGVLVSPDQQADGVGSVGIVPVNSLFLDIRLIVEGMTAPVGNIPCPAGVG